VFFVVHRAGLSLAPGSLNPELRAVSLSLREKQSLYHSLAQLVRSGVPFPSALENLARTTRGGMRNVVRRLKDSVAGGQTVGEAFARQHPAVGEMEMGVIAATERAGKLERGLTQLSEYFGALEQARAGILKKCAYPAFVLHFGVFALSLRTLLFGGGVAAYLKQTFGFLALVYGVVLVIALLVPLMRDAGSVSAALDALLRTLPLVGKIRSALSTSRFCATYEMQLDAGINVIDALQAAQRASRSGLIRRAVARAIPEVRGGAQVGAALAASGAFPEPMIRCFCIGEQTGEIDQELKRLAAEYQAEGLARLETLAEWLPRLFYIAILGYVGYGVIVWYQSYLSQAMGLLDSN
jgi:type II secretory pathway component PulF